MFFRKIAGPMRIDSESDTGGSVKLYRLKGRPGGRTTKVLQYMIKVYQTSTDAEVGLDVEHGPDGEIYGLLKAGVIDPTPIATTPKLLTGAVGAVAVNEEVIGEWILPIVTVVKGTGVQFAVVEVFEMRKPF